MHVYQFLCLNIMCCQLLMSVCNDFGRWNGKWISIGESHCEVIRKQPVVHSSVVLYFQAQWYKGFLKKILKLSLADLFICQGTFEFSYSLFSAFPVYWYAMIIESLPFPIHHTYIFDLVSYVGVGGDCLGLHRWMGNFCPNISVHESLHQWLLAINCSIVFP